MDDSWRMKLAQALQTGMAVSKGQVPPVFSQQKPGFNPFQAQNTAQPQQPAFPQSQSPALESYRNSPNFISLDQQRAMTRTS